MQQCCKWLEETHNILTLSVCFMDAQTHIQLVIPIFTFNDDYFLINTLCKALIKCHFENQSLSTQ